MKKVLIVCDYFPPDIHGGAEISTYELVKHISGRFQVDIFTTYDTLNTGPKFETIDGFSVHRIYSKKLKFLINYGVVLRPLVLFKFYKFLKKNNYDLIHFNNVGFKLSFSVLFLPKLFHTPSIITFRDAVSIVNGKFNKGLDDITLKRSIVNEIIRNKFTYNPFRNILIQLLINRVDHKIAISGLLKKLLESNGIKIDQVYFNRIYFVNNNFEKNISSYILYVGRPSLDKGFFDVIKQVNYISKRYAVTLKIVGFDKSELSEAVIEYISNNDLDQFIEFHKWIPQQEIFIFISKAFCVVFPSRYIDAFGRVILESILSNTPVLVSKFAGASELLFDEMLVYNPFNAIELSQKLDYCIENNNIIRESIKSKSSYYNTFNLEMPNNNYYFEIYEKFFKS